MQVLPFCQRSALPAHSHTVMYVHKHVYIWPCNIKSRGQPAKVEGSRTLSGMSELMTSCQCSGLISIMTWSMRKLRSSTGPVRSLETHG